MANEIRRVGGSLTVVRRINGTIGSQGRVGGSINRATTEYASVYEGPYSVTPTQQTQVLQTQNKKATDVITINPIPSNYGLITWNGSTLTVS